MQYVQKLAEDEGNKVKAVVFHGDVQTTPKKLEYDIRIPEPAHGWMIGQKYVKSYTYTAYQGESVASPSLPVVHTNRKTATALFIIIIIIIKFYN